MGYTSNTEETIIAMRQLKECGVKVIFDAENIDTLSADNELMITIISAFAQAENDEPRKNQYWAIKKRLEDSTSELYKRTCYGYRKGDKGELIINSSLKPL